MFVTWSLCVLLFSLFPFSFFFCHSPLGTRIIMSDHPALDLGRQNAIDSARRGRSYPCSCTMLGKKGRNEKIKKGREGRGLPYLWHTSLCRSMKIFKILFELLCSDGQL
jgi:hypothetical protein